MLKARYVLLLWIFIYSFKGYSEKIIITDQTSSFVGEKVMFFLDSTSLISTDEITNTMFTYGSHNINNFQNYSGNLWFKVDLENKDTKLPFLEIRNALLEEVIVFEVKSNKLVKIFETGIKKKFKDRPILSEKFAFHLPLHQYESKTFYVLCKSFYPLHLPILIHSSDEYINTKHHKDIFWGLYVGVILFAIIYNLFVFLTVREKFYLYYILYVFIIALFYLSLQGFGFEYFWPNFPSINFYMPCFISLGTIMIILFAFDFLRLKETSKKSIWAGYFMIALCLLVVIVNFLVGHGIADTLAQMFSLIISIYLIVIGFISLKKGVKTARFYLIAWFLFMIFVVIFILTLNNVFESNFFTTHAIFIGHMSEVLLLSVALADRINILKQDNTNKQQQLITQLKENQLLQTKVNRELEAKVLERTKKIQETNEELTSMNEEIVQQSEEIISQRDTLSDTLTELDRKNTRITRSITYAQRIQKALLPCNKTIENIIPESFIIYEPKDIVSGDYYWSYYNEESQTLILSVMDCTGHGVPGAFMSVIGINILNQLVQNQGLEDPSTILLKANNELHMLLNAEDNITQYDSMEGVVCSIDFKSKKIKVAGAGGNALFIRNEEVTRFKGEFRVLGQEKMDVPFKVSQFDFKTSTELYLFSDGYQDQFGEETQKKFSGKKFRSLIESISKEEISNQKERLEEELNTWKGREEQTDDVTILGFKLQ